MLLLEHVFFYGRDNWGKIADEINKTVCYENTMNVNYPKRTPQGIRFYV